MCHSTSLNELHAVGMNSTIFYDVLFGETLNTVMQSH